MGNANVFVITPGLLTTVQDLGRWGAQSRGVSVSGPMDSYAHRLANALVGNDPRAATLEITLAGPEVEFGDARVVAVTGATFTVTVDGAPIPASTAVAVPAGKRLKFGHRSKGARAYLGIEGGVAVSQVLGSRATHVRTAMGGFEGRALKPRDTLPLGPRKGVRPPAMSARSEDYIGLPALRVLAGPQVDRFAGDRWTTFLNSSYTVDQKSDRMAFRLIGPPISYDADAETISDATPMGTLQVLPSGLPVLLMADRQTIGGYPQIATVISADLRIAGQLAPGDELSFRSCTMAEAMAALIDQERALMKLEGRTA